MSSTTAAPGSDAEVRAALAMLSADQLDHIERLIAEERAQRDRADDAAVEAMSGEQAQAFLAAATVEDPSLVPA